MVVCLGLAWLLPPSAHLTPDVHAQSAPPFWISTPVVNATVNEPYEYFTLALDPAGKPVTYSAISVPTWLSLVPASSPTIYTVAGTLERGSGLPATDVQLWSPSAGGYDGNGNLYIADRNNHRVWRVSPDGVLTTFAGTGASGFDGDGGAATRARLFDPTGIAISSTGDVYVADRQNHRIRRISPEGTIMTVAGTGTAGFTGDGISALEAALNLPGGVGLDSSGRVVIADTGNSRLRVVEPTGLIRTLAGTGKFGYNGEGVAADEANLIGPWSVVGGPAGEVVFSEPGGNRVRRIGRDGKVYTVAGTGALGSTGDGGLATKARLASPQGVALDAEGGILIADTLSSRIRRVGTDGIINAVAGTGALGFSGDGGQATAASLVLPEGVAIVHDGGFVVFDSYNDRVRRVDAANIINTIAGRARYGSSGDGGPGTLATFVSPRGGAYGSDGSFYIGEAGSHRVRRLLNDGTVVHIAGSGNRGFSGDGGPATAANLAYPSDVAVDALGNVFVSDTGNHRIRMIASDGVITTFAGTGTPGGVGDGGPALSAQLLWPRGLVFDVDGNLYVADQGNRRVRRIDTDGIIQSVAGTGEPGSDGDGGPALAAKLNNPEGLALDAAGNLFISDPNSSRVRKISLDGVIQTVAGSGVRGFGGDGGQATAAQLDMPSGLAVGLDGTLYIADYGNHRIRSVAPGGIIQSYAGSGKVGQGGGGHYGDGGPPSAAALIHPSDVEIRADGELVIVEEGLGFLRKVFASGTFLRGTPTPGAAGLRAVSLRAAAGSLSSTQEFEILVESSPFILQQPESQELAQGQTVVLSVTASGTKPLSFQWLHEGAVLSETARVTGTATAQLTITDLLPSDAGEYQVVVLNNSGSTLSDVVTLTVKLPVGPSIGTQPKAVEVRLGATAQFEVAATGTEPLNYLWFHGDQALVEGGRFSGTRAPQLSIAAVEAGDAGNYKVQVHNGVGSITSDPALLTVDTRVAPEITSPPESQVVVEALDATFRVEASGTAPLEYAWSKDGTPLVESEHFVGVATPEFRIVSAQLADQGAYTVKVTNGVGEDTSDPAVLTVNPRIGPSITKQPEPYAGTETLNATLQVEASGTAPLSYLWSKDGTALVESGHFVGVATPELRIMGLELADQGNYTATVRNAVGTAVSEPAMVTVLAAKPNVTRQPVSQDVKSGAEVSFTVAAEGLEPFEYQWSRNGNPLQDDDRFSGTRTAELKLKSATTGDSGDYTVLVQNNAGTATSAAARLNVTLATPPAISQARLTGGNISFLVTGSAGEKCRIDYSTDLVSWQPLKELVLDGTGIEVTDPAAGLRRFYRAVVP